MANPLNIDVNLNLPETPKGVPEAMDGEMRRVYNALRALARYLSGSVGDAIAAATPVRGAGQMVAGSYVVVNPLVVAGTRVFVTVQGLGTVTVPQPVHVVVVAGVGFTITSASPTDTSVVAWMYYQ